jgi:membrane associated rhomboid family serine protease
MVLLVPVSPEVPKNQVPRFWPGLLLVLVLVVSYQFVHSIIEADLEYVSNMGKFLFFDEEGKTQLSDEGHLYLSKRPLLVLASAKGDWSWNRLVVSNFIHGSVGHLILNMLGIFAGARICSTFLPFSTILFIFLFGGTLGLFGSIRMSTELSNYIPHVGASGGIFALMGTYYVYNFRFRTRYFFWFPSRQGMISLKTSWFFFVDVLLLELVLTAAQLLPQRTDTVDHIAHVIGFITGLFLALAYRAIVGWQPWLQTKAEFDEWRKIRMRKSGQLIEEAFRSWCDLLAINPYNDLVKQRLCDLVSHHSAALNPLQISEAFGYLSPTFLRLHTRAASECVVGLLENQLEIPKEWLKKTPYDSIIRLAQKMASTQERHKHMYRLVSEYRLAHPEGDGTERKLELLLNKLEGFLPRQDLPKPLNTNAGAPEDSRPTGTTRVK